ncbi:UTP--glucose-1-phosphate uridylyltransferase [Brachybacterium muris]|uniref:UTP--glucose-1-phosphate uridylyltransferase n=1 Tax=Brachybacterium muris TaxID=219301 RepID=UPI00223B3CD4|nr:UTP--glucose-1-phosphate uridylyltransferase [Brachybacterium muris]MCT2177328.1 UTP--glucose-1-phosphate uridylyltransferase [Brachybacterium muris]MCT2296578.1 UTP--glucose-1-phosphate uridylyltransferase [Brachybacterium muris]
MSTEGLSAAQQKMIDEGVPQTAIDVFTHYYGQLEEGVTGSIPEDTIQPYLDPPKLDDVKIDPAHAKQVFDQLAIINLNGGLGTSMGLDKAKSLLPVRDGKTFLDIIVGQVLAARRGTNSRLPLIFMNSFRTRQDTLDVLAKYPDLQVGDLPLDFLQNKEPKLRTDDLTPVEWEADPTLEWCPPGHGDIYTALQTSGLLQQLLDAGFKYASVSNSDNLGTVPSPVIASWFASTGAPYAAELCRRTAADRKGGHLAVRKSDGRLILRDTAQTPEEEMDFFTDEHRHPYFHTNNLWFDLEQLDAVLKEREGVMGLPLIRNEKTVDPSDKTSPAVYQIESAMGAAIEVFEGATAIVVGRDRFLPVKATSDLLLVRSDLYALDQRQALVQQVPSVPAVKLASEPYKLINDFEARFPQGVPSLKEAVSLDVQGDWTFGQDVSVIGDAVLGAEGGTVPDGARVGTA